MENLEMLTLQSSQSPEDDNEKEKEAVMYLLSLGYTISKPPKIAWTLGTTNFDWSNMPMGS